MVLCLEALPSACGMSSSMISKGFSEIGKSFIPTTNELKKAKKKEEEIKEAKEKRVGEVISGIGLAYDIYKKAHRFFVP